VISRVAVVLPAADEEESIGACLSAIRDARRHLHEASGGAVRSRVVVVLDGCRDATASIVAGFADVDSVVSSARCVGTARRMGATYALTLDRPARDVWLANTDADCLVPRDWLTRMVDDADRGINLVLGTVRPAPGLTAAVERAWLAAHHQRDDHPHVHAANLGIDARSYLDLGGWRDLPGHEDADLVDRAAASGHLRIRRTGGIAVVTSSRLHGRAPVGFAGYLRDLDSGLSEAS
jgi:glycosyltransferase involved in cell wall biosynthesis